MVALNGAIISATLKRVARLDLIYGITATLIIIVGFGRAIFAAKGWGYYSHNGFFSTPESRTVCTSRMKPWKSGGSASTAVPGLRRLIARIAAA